MAWWIYKIGHSIDNLRCSSENMTVPGMKSYLCLWCRIGRLFTTPLGTRRVCWCMDAILQCPLTWCGGALTNSLWSTASTWPIYETLWSPYMNLPARRPSWHMLERSATAIFLPTTVDSTLAMLCGCTTSSERRARVRSCPNSWTGHIASLIRSTMSCIGSDGDPVIHGSWCPRTDCDQIGARLWKRDGLPSTVTTHDNVQALGQATLPPQDVNRLHLRESSRRRRVDDRCRKEEVSTCTISWLILHISEQWTSRDSVSSDTICWGEFSLDGQCLIADFLACRFLYYASC